MPLTSVQKTSLETARSNYVSTLATLSTEVKPTYNVNGQSFSWVEYQRFLLEQIDKIDLLLVADQTPFEHVSQGFT